MLYPVYLNRRSERTTWVRSVQAISMAKAKQESKCSQLKSFFAFLATGAERVRSALLRCRADGEDDQREADLSVLRRNPDEPDLQCLVESVSD